MDKELAWREMDGHWHEFCRLATQAADYEKAGLKEEAIFCQNKALEAKHKFNEVFYKLDEEDKKNGGGIDNFLHDLWSLYSNSGSVRTGKEDI